MDTAERDVRRKCRFARGREGGGQVLRAFFFSSLGTASWKSEFKFVPFVLCSLDREINNNFDLRCKHFANLVIGRGGKLLGQICFNYSKQGILSHFTKAGA